MAPGRRKGSGRASAAAAARKQWKVGDLVLAKMKGFPAWPARVSEPKKWGYSSDRKKLLVYFYGTKQIAFCNYADIEAFTEEKKKSLLIKRQGKGADFVRAVDEIIDIYETLKKQNLAEVNSGDEGIESDAGNLEGSRSKSIRKSPEISSNITNNHQSEALYASLESCDVVNLEEISAASMEGDLHCISTVTNCPTEKVSILDQLRKTPLANTTTKKRQRDAPLPIFVVQRLPSLRRSRSSSGGDPYKLQKSRVLPNGTDLASGGLVPDAVQEESTLKEKSMGEVSHISVCGDGVAPVSADLSFIRSSEDMLSEIAAVKYEAINLDEGNLESSCLMLNVGVRLNGKLDLPMKTVILKKKRKPIRKRVTNTTECAKLDKEADFQVELRENLSESPNSRNEVNEKFSKADGDEHLPLVKRARVRMGKPPVEERQLDEVVGTKEKTEVAELINKSDKHPTSSSAVNSFPAHRTSSRVKEASSSSPINDCTVSTGRDLRFWKVNKYQLKGVTLDVEAALPPSKRLHRALEAMSANVAQATNDSPEAPSNLEKVRNGCTDSPKGNSVHLSADENVGSPTRSQCIQSSDSPAIYNSTSGLSSSLASQNLQVATLTSSEVEPDDTLIGHLKSPYNKDCKEILMDVKECDGSYTSKIANTEIHDTRLRSCSFKFVEKPMNATSSEGVSDQLSSPLGEENETHQLTKECSYSQGDNTGGNGMERIVQKPHSILNSNEDDDLSLPNVSGMILSATNLGSTASHTPGATKSSSSQSDESIQASDMQDVAKEVKHRETSKDRGISSDLAPMKDLIAAAQAKRLLSRSTTFLYNVVDCTVPPDAVVSPSLIYREDSSVQGSPPNPMTYRRPASDDRTHYLQNGRRSPLTGLRDNSFNKLTGHVEVTAARRSFEALLCTLSRTKESIGRATCMAMDCVKYGIAGEVVEILLQNLEREPSLYKRVDLFFLVDSITQFSRSQKGGAGDVYLSLVQSVLPRLLSAVAPAGNAAWENRRQCLKVLRLWVERKTLPESIIRHHIRDLESVNESSLTSAYSRRPPRTERALNDPVREMEGMLVDEYGSNTSFQLPRFLQPSVLEDEDGSADDEKGFEAVTPERTADVDDEKEMTQTSTEKHRHILEDVDGELEMEDVAPPCGAEVSSTCHAAGVNAICNTHCQHEHHHSLCFAPLPPLPEDMQLSPPPLPSSPPPMAPTCSPPLSLVPQQQLAGSYSCTDAIDVHPSSVSQNMPNQVPLSIAQQQNNLHGNLMSSESVPYYAHGYGGPPKPMPPPLSSLSSSGSYVNLSGSHPAMHSGNNVQPIVSALLPNKAYHLQPPPPTISNQFSYVQAEPQQSVQSLGSSSFSDRFQCGHDTQGGNFFGDRGTRGPIHHEIAERGIFSPAVNAGPILSDKAETLPSSLSHYGLPAEPSPIPCRGWSLPPRTSGYSIAASRPLLENPISRVTGAPGYWRPRYAPLVCCKPVC